MKKNKKNNKKIKKSISKIKKYLFNLLIVAATTFICLFVCEIVIRIFFKDKIVLYPRYQTDAKYGEYRIRKIRPNLNFKHTSKEGSWKFTINKQGFRSNYDFSYKKNSNTLRIIVLGDSHTQGFEVRQDFTYSAVIEKHLNKHGYKSEVFNTGISGFSTAEELVFLENEGVKYRPDFVVLGFYANDLEDNIKANIFVLNDNELIVQKKEHIPGVRIQNIIYKIPLTKFLSENSYFYSLLFNTVWNNFKKTLYKKKEDSLVTEYAIPVGKISDYQISLEAKLLECMYTFCKSNDIKLIILDIPTLQGSSFPPELYEIAKNNCDIFINSASELNDYSGIAEIHVPYGHRHISEFTHILLGVTIAKSIIANLNYLTLP